MADAIPKGTPRGLPPQRGEVWKHRTSGRQVRIKGIDGGFREALVEYSFLDKPADHEGGDMKLLSFVRQYEYDRE